MPAALQKITHRIHGQRTLLVPSILMRRGYLETAHLSQIKSETAYLSQIKSETHALLGRFYQIRHRSEAAHHRMKALPNYDHLPQAERNRYLHEIMDDTTAFLDRTEPRMAHLQAMKKKITQFKLN